MEILSFHTSVPEMTIIWFMVPGIRSITNKIVCNLGPLFLKLWFTPCKAEQPLKGMELQEKETQKD